MLPRQKGGAPIDGGGRCARTIGGEFVVTA
jgi:hypothetical protein